MAYRIMMSGGGTMGSVSPLLAVSEVLREDLRCSFVWVGTKTGPERLVVKQAGIPFVWIASGKFRRYLSWQTLITPLFVFFGFLQALYLMGKYKPKVLLTCGSFVSVPLAYAAWVFRIPVFLHQQDFEVGLANKLMKPIAAKVSVVFEEMVPFFGKKAVVTGHPIRQEMVAERQKALAHFGFKGNKPVVLITGGGTGAQALNEIVQQSFSVLTKAFDVIHTTGKGKSLLHQKQPGYVRAEFFSGRQMGLAYAACDVVISRAGASALCELVALGKKCLIIPMPQSHQEENAHFFAKKFGLLVVEQKTVTPHRLMTHIQSLLKGPVPQKGVFANSAKNVAEYVKSYVGS